jgi:hypothetical protein
MALDSTFAFVRRLCCPAIDFDFTLWIMIMFYTMLTSLVCIKAVEFASLEGK